LENNGGEQGLIETTLQSVQKEHPINDMQLSLAKFLLSIVGTNGNPHFP
jgi:hypothetical protein